MIRTHILAAALILFGLASAQAQTIPVRSGEHADFTRLVMRVPGGVRWDMAQSERKVSIAFSNPGLSFDVASVFDRIPRLRVQRVAQAAPGAPLEIGLGCDCPVTAVLTDRVFLVVDIRNPQNEPISTFAAIPSSPYRFGETFGHRPGHMPSQIGQLIPAPQPNTPAPDQGPATATDLALPLLPDPAVARELSTAQLRLLEQVSRAANQGLLTPRVQSVSLPENRSASSAGQTVLKAETRADRDLSQIDIRPPSATPVTECLPDHLVAVGDWANGESLQDAIGTHRTQVTSETGDFQPEKVLGLARLYVHYGFGLEAAQLLRLAEMETRPARVTLSLARLMDAPRAAQSHVWQDQLACASDVALWAFLSSDAIKSAPGPDVSTAIQRTFSKLPGHLRTHLGPPLSQQFLKVGDDKRATDILRAIELESDVPEQRNAHAKADVALKRGQMEAAKTNLAEAIEVQDENSPLALAKLIETHHRDGTAPATPLSELAAGYAKEFRGTDLGGRLHRAQVLAHILEGDLHAALATLRQPPQGTAPENTGRGYTDIFRAAVERLDDQGFLELVLSELPNLPKQVSNSVMDAVAKRLIDLGFSGQAGQLLADAEGPRRTERRRLLRAEVALEQGKPNRALVELAGLASDAAPELRARAMQQIEDQAAATRSFNPDENLETVARDDWSSGTWSLPPLPSAEGSDAADRLAAMLDTRPADTDGSLGAARALLDGSARTRADIETVLKSVPVDPAQ